MKTLGIIGGMSPASTVTYYAEINRLVNEQKGANTTAPLILYSVNFEEIVQFQKRNAWDKAGEYLASLARKLQEAGAEGILIGSNTMTKSAPEVRAAVSVPLVDIVDATASSIKQQGLTKVALLGTQFVMQQDFYRNGLRTQGIEAITPDLAEQAEIHRIIFEELCVGKILPEAKAFYLKVIERLAKAGAQGVILGCTEIGLLIKQGDHTLPFFDTAEIHSKAAAEFILTEE